MAATNLQAGSVVITEQPFVSVLSKSQRAKASILQRFVLLDLLRSRLRPSACVEADMSSGLQRCGACFRQLPVNPVFCQSCAAVAFCSARCRDDAARDGGHAAGGPECGLPWSVLQLQLLMGIGVQRLRPPAPLGLTACHRAA